ncbi:hypothetical protein [Arthrobacter mobilis]|uniref:Uncharacterized protein n=1 Tax=Arthrobacter mobilis TaxID=2724944 RepID=A0A7X6HEJ6_9MICC|nr:hypothetical protein [Arthrobacter mobilis]NKX54794.1 hypothetical protein [Arthrobacter mobilis]
MGRREGSDTANSGQPPAQIDGHPLPAGVWEDPGGFFGSVCEGRTGTGVPGGSPQGLTTVIPARARAGSRTRNRTRFTVDHPLDPENRYLSHSSVWSAEMLNVYSGTVTTDDKGAAQVRLPEYCEALNTDFRYQLTAVGQFAQVIVAEEIDGSAFTIRTDRPHVKVCWQVTGVRQDAWAAANPLTVEEDKADGERGRYLYPELYAQDEEVTVPRPAIREALPERAAGLVPEDLQEQAGSPLQLLIQDNPVDDEDLRRLLSGIRDRAEATAAAARARLKEQWGELHED